MAIFREGKTYRVQVYVAGKRICAKGGFNNKTEAGRWENEQRYVYESQTHRGINADSPITKFSQISDHYKNSRLKTLKYNTQKRYLLDIEQKIEPYFSNFNPNKISPRMIQDFQSKLSQQGLSNRSVNHCLIVLGTIFKTAYEIGFSNQNPVSKIRQYQHEEKDFRYWSTKQDVKNFLNCNLTHPLYLFFRLALETGMRAGELVGLQKAAINFESGCITIKEQYIEANRALAPLKNNKIRHVWVNSEMLGLLAAFAKEKAGTFVFTKADGTPLSTTSVCNLVFARAQKKAQVPLINFHGLRHTFASHFLMKGGSIYHLKELLGHSDIKTTQRYAHLSKTELSKSRGMVSFESPSAPTKIYTSKNAENQILKSAIPGLLISTSI